MGRGGRERYAARSRFPLRPRTAGAARHQCSRVGADSLQSNHGPDDKPHTGLREAVPGCQSALGLPNAFGRAVRDGWHRRTNAGGGAAGAIDIAVAQAVEVTVAVAVALFISLALPFEVTIVGIVNLAAAVTVGDGLRRVG